MKKGNKFWFKGQLVAWIDREGQAHVKAKIHDIIAMKAALSWLEGWERRERGCIHGNRPGECSACDVEADLAFDANREGTRK